MIALCTFLLLSVLVSAEFYVEWEKREIAHG